MAELIEIRQYPMIPGRFERFHDLMRDTASRLFDQHGFHPPLGAWESYIGASAPALIYVLKWSSIEERDRCWNNFYADPEWFAALKENFGGAPRVDHAYVSVHEPTSLGASGFERRLPGVFQTELLFVGGPTLERVEADVENVLVPAIEGAGGRVRSSWRTIWGRPREEVALLLEWPSEAASLALPHAEELVLSRQIMQPVDYLQPEAQ